MGALSSTRLKNDTMIGSTERHACFRAETVYAGRDFACFLNRRESQAGLLHWLLPICKVLENQSIAVWLCYSVSEKNHNLAGIGPITFCCCCCCYFCCCLLYQFRFFCIMIYSVQSFSPDKSTSVRLIFTFAFVVSAQSCLSYLVFLDVMLLHAWKYRGFAWAQAC